uniref:Uncharacterized protein n=1 Tax=Heterorhabditis bacteriophora TaxID=37862 RepID=A0A1I7WSD9_HETBA
MSSGRPSYLDDREKMEILRTTSNARSASLESVGLVALMLQKVFASLSTKTMPQSMPVEAPRPGWRTMT